jgi:hypothetical protein
MLELLKGNPQFSEVFAFNSISVPNSSSHWILVFLLSIFSSFTAAKIIVTLTFAGFVAVCGWLRLKTTDATGIKTSFLIGATIGFNWLWFSGFYNFITGVICFTITITLFYKWREKMNVWRTIILSILILITYFSHLISFGILAGSLFLMAVTVPKSELKKSLTSLFIAFLPIIPLLILYKSISVSGGAISPVWRNLDNPFSPVNWILQIRGADASAIISRKTFPFIEHYSSLFAVFTPFLWMLLAFGILFFATSKARKEIVFKGKKVFVFLFGFLFLAALFSPDDFGLNHGSILRERLLICSLVFIIPIFQAEKSLRLKRIAQFCLIFVVIFQTTAIWDYALKTNREAKQLLAVENVVKENDSVASVVIVNEGWRFHSQPMLQINNYLGIEKNLIVWDNYEPGYYVFPIVPKIESDKNTFYELSNTNFYSLDKPTMSDATFNANLKRLEVALSDNNRIKTMIVWGKDSRIEEVLNRYFIQNPDFQNEYVRLFYRK